MMGNAQINESVIEHELIIDTNDMVISKYDWSIKDAFEYNNVSYIRLNWITLPRTTKFIQSGNEYVADPSSSHNLNNNRHLLLEVSQFKPKYFATTSNTIDTNTYVLHYKDPHGPNYGLWNCKMNTKNIDVSNIDRLSFILKNDNGSVVQLVDQDEQPITLSDKVGVCLSLTLGVHQVNIGQRPNYRGNGSLW